jgi:hypothetical protein
MARIVPFTKNREVIHDLLKRSQRFHATCSGQHEIDVTDLLAVLDARRAAGDPVSLNAVLIKATSLLLRKYPRLNHHLFHDLFGRRFEVDFENICCNVVLLRRHRGEAILLPVLLEDSDRLPVEEIDDVLNHHKRAPLDELPQLEGLQKLKRMPWFMLKLFSFKARSDPRFYRRYFGTYGFSSGILDGPSGVKIDEGPTVTHALANTATGFLPTSVAERPLVRDGEVVIRKMLSITVLIDHYVLDGHEAFLAMRYLARLLGRPAKLGL